MAFSYDLESTDNQILLISQVRLEIGDTVEDSGVRPDGSNLSDAEILIWLGRTSNSIAGAAALASDALSRMWAGVRDVEDIGSKDKASQVSQAWASLAIGLRGSIYGGFAVEIGRNDGYCDT